MINLEEELKMEEDINNLEKTIRKYGFMSIKENKTLEKLYEKIKESDLTELFYDNNKFKNCFFRGRLFNKEEKETIIKKEGNEFNQYLSFVQPPLKVKLSIARFNHINNSYFYLSNSKYAPYFELEKFKQENKEKELFVQAYEIKNKNLNLLNTNKIDNFIRTKLGLPTNTFDIKNRSILSDNYNVSNFFIDLFKLNKNTIFNGVFYNNKKSFNIFLKEKNKFILETNVINNILLYENITFFSDYWSYETIKLEDLYEIENNTVKDENKIKEFKDSGIIELTEKTKENCLEASTYFEPVGQPKKINVENIIIDTFNSIVLRKQIKYDILNKPLLECFINCDFKKLITSGKMKINDFFKTKLKSPKLEFLKPDDILLSFDMTIDYKSYEIPFKFENNQIYFENEIEGKETLLKYTMDIFKYFFGIYYKLELNSEEILLTKV